MDKIKEKFPVGERVSTPIGDGIVMGYLKRPDDENPHKVAVLFEDPISYLYPVVSKLFYFPVSEVKNIFRRESDAQ